MNIGICRSSKASAAVSVTAMIGSKPRKTKAIVVAVIEAMSSGVGYTLQILAQKDANPTVVSLLLSLESVFSVLAGALILHDRLTGDRKSTRLNSSHAT